MPHPFPRSLPLVLLHIGQLKPLGFALWISSTCVTFVSALWYWMNRHASED